MADQSAKIGDSSITEAWDPFTFDDAFCQVDKYEVDCEFVCQSGSGADCSDAIYEIQTTDSA